MHISCGKCCTEFRGLRPLFSEVVFPDQTWNAYFARDGWSVMVLGVGEHRGYQSLVAFVS